ncbi:MAG: nitroreductase family protein [Candidatus Diapherotrites archaeon]
MDVKEAIEKRRSIRAYKSHEISDSEIETLVEAARLAPSAKNLQPCNFIIVRDAAVKKKVAQACLGQMFMAQASAVFCVVVDEKISRWTSIDAAIALEHIALQATELGYGCCWIGAFDEAEVKKALKVPANLKVVALMPVGKADEKPAQRPRKGKQEFVFYEEFGKN